VPWSEQYLPLNGVRLNMVVGPGGQFADESGSSRGISNEIDRSLLVHLRALSEVVVTGGETARIEQYRKPRSAALAIISRRPAVIVDAISLTPPATSEVATWCIAELRRFGFTRILLEVGPSLAREFLQRDLVDEFCLTLTDGELKTGQMIMNQFESPLQLSSRQSIEGTLFTIWRRGNAN
jgi:riboflavin biosynthesis pyrimidine reductase